MNADGTQRDYSVRALLEAGADLTGGVVGAVAGAATGDVSSIVLAPVVSVAVQHAVQAVGQRMLDREQARAGAALRFIYVDAEARSQGGEKPRDDGFFDSQPGVRADAEELLEGVLRQAAESWEEQKVPFLANLWSATAHDGDVSPADASYLTRLAGDLTYRQLVALAVFGHSDEHFRPLARAASLREEGRATPDPVVIVELDELGRRGLLGVRADDGTVRDPAGLWGGDTVGGTSFGKIRLTHAGERLWTLLGLDRIPADERARWVDCLAS